MSMDTDERTATALERIADALERAHPVEYRRTGLDAAWDACEVAEGYLDGSGAARLSDDPLDILAEIMTAIETGCDMVTYSLRPQSNAQQTVDAMHAAVALLRETVMRYTGPTVTVDARSLETGEPVPVSVTVRKLCGETFDDSCNTEERVWVCTETDGHVGYHYDAARLVGWGKKLPSMTPDYAAAILSRQTEPDPLDEDDHRPRHFTEDGEHLYWNEECGRWHTEMTNRHMPCDCRLTDTRTLAWWDEPLTFCDCP